MDPRIHFFKELPEVCEACILSESDSGSILCQQWPGLCEKKPEILYLILVSLLLSGCVILRKSYQLTFRA